MREPRVAIIILNWNGYEDTVQCLRSLEKLKYDNFSVVLVDNGSENNEARRLEREFPHIQLIANRYNRGFAGGNNDGMRRALKDGAEYIVNLNNDCLVEEEWLSRLVKCLRRTGADYGASEILFLHRRDFICSEGDVLLPDGSASAVNQHKKRIPGKRTRELFSACGAASIYSAECLKRVRVRGDEYFDELYFAYYEDVDLGIRLKMSGHTGVLAADAVVYHRMGSSVGKYSVQNRFYTEKNRLLNVLLNFPADLMVLAFFYYFVRQAYLLSDRRRKGGGAPAHGYVKNIGVARTFKAVITAWSWVISNMAPIIKDRRERKARGLVRRDIAKYFKWSFQ